MKKRKDEEEQEEEEAWGTAEALDVQTVVSGAHQTAVLRRASAPHSLCLGG